MSEVLDRLEETRLGLGLTQLALSRELGITQPHYSKVMGGIANLTPNLEGRIKLWLNDRPVGRVDPTHDPEVLDLSRAIERASRRLAVLLAGTGRRLPRRKVSRTKSKDSGRRAQT